MSSNEKKIIFALRKELSAAHVTSATLATSVSQLTKVLDDINTTNAELRKENESLKERLENEENDVSEGSVDVENALKEKEEMIELLQNQLQDLREGKDDIKTSRQIQLSNITGRPTYPLAVTPTTTIKSIRAALVNTLRCDPIHLRMTFNGVLLEDNYIIAAYGITDGAKLTFGLNTAQE